MPIGAAKGFAQLNAFVEHHAPRHVKAVLQLVCANPHAGVLDGGDFFQVAVKSGGNQGIKLRGLLYAAVKDCIEMGCVAFVKACQLAGELVNVLCTVATYQMLVKRLHDKFAGAGAACFGCFFGWLARCWCGFLQAGLQGLLGG